MGFSFTSFLENAFEKTFDFIEDFADNHPKISEAVSNAIDKTSEVVETIGEKASDLTQTLDDKATDLAPSLNKTVERTIVQKYENGEISQTEYINQMQNLIASLEFTAKKRYTSGKSDRYGYEQEMFKCQELLMKIIELKYKGDKRIDIRDKYRDIHKNAVNDTSKYYYQNLTI